MERTYVFNQDGNNGNGGGSKFDIMAMLPNLMGSKGVDPGLLALLNQGRGSQDQWGGSDMGERRMPGYFPEYPVYNERRDSQPYGDDMGERRRRRANGEFM